MTFCYVDTESMGLNLDTHDLWELAWAIEGGDIHSGLLTHYPEQAEKKALEVNRYEERMTEDVATISDEFEVHFHDTLQSYRRGGSAVTLVGANPSFDAYRLRKRWGGAEPWHYRMLDIGVYAMPWEGSTYPLGLRQVAQQLRNHGEDIPQPDHTAAGDVATVRACHQALISIYQNAVF